MSDKTINELTELTDVSQTDELIIYDSSETEGNPTKKVKVANLLKNNYSTEEHPTGAKWIDGKPIYRSVITGTWTSGTNLDVPFSPVDKIIKLNIIAYDNGGGFVNSYYQQSSDFLNAYYEVFGKLFHLRRGSAYPALPLTYYLTVEYTKTTN